MKKINLDNKNLWAEIFNSNLIRRLTPKYLGTTHKIGEHSGKIERIFDSSWDLDAGWIHVHLDPNRDCMTYYLLFDGFNIIPEPCLNCWKVVVKVRTVKELFQLYNLQCDLPDDVYCKCGLDLARPYVANPYNGYFYTNSFEAGQERKAQIRKLVDKQISPDVPVILKKYCTEYELHFSDPNEIQQSNDKWKEIADKWIVKYPKPKSMPWIVVINVMEKWIRAAAEVLNDPSYREFTNGCTLYPQPKEY